MGEKWNTSAISDLSGKCAVVTGANSGLGFYTSKWLAANGAEVVMVCRNKAKAEKAVQKIKNKHMACKLKINITDLSDLDQVRLLADWLNQEYKTIDILVNNAGIMGVPQGLTRQGFETQWGVNYLAHFSLTDQIFHLLNKDTGRVVNLSSLAAQKGHINWQDPNFAENYKSMEAYQQSKLAMLMFSLALHRRVERANYGMRCIAAHPGFSSTNLFTPVARKMNGVVAWLSQKLWMPFMTQGAEQGALPQLFAATSPLAESGEYYGPDGKKERKGYPAKAEIPEQASGEEDQDGLWLMTEDLLNTQFKVA